ncbi:type I polyketide synthase [Phytohabitans flavus]|uniref:type I polyketide synthase n=1 Tax=Phytohabitans flavus TaxID=1076124 RepID=UPI003642AC5F
MTAARPWSAAHRRSSRYRGRRCRVWSSRRKATPSRSSGSPEASRLAGRRDLWQHLAAGRCLVTEVPAERFDWRAVDGDPRREPHTTNSHWGGFLPSVDRFDAEFFGISPVEAALMDPQQRLFLQAAWHAIEDAGHAPARLRGSRTGVFVGVSGFDYHELLTTADRHEDAHAPSGVSHAVLANRLSYLLDLRGPSEPVDTACSSALVAVHRAVRAMAAGDCDGAVVGGANLLLTRELFVAFGQAGFLSPDGRCFAFDDRANGYVRAEGVAAMFLRPLSRAVADGDPVYGVIRASATNHGGRTQSLTVPNPHAQTALVVDAYRRAGVDPRTVSYIETHGTGTALGDPIEVEALKRAFTELGAGPADQPWCGLGSVKSNVGHLEAAAGMAGLFKVLLSLRHDLLPATVELHRTNPMVELAGSLFTLVDRPRAWTVQDGQPRRAGVSSFGFGGANAHVLVEEHRMDPVPVPDQEVVLPLSARTPGQLHDLATRLAAFLAAETGAAPAEVAWTLQAGRDPMAHRAAVVGRTVADLVAGLRQFLDGDPSPRVWSGLPGTESAGDTATAPPETGDPADWARRWVAGDDTLPWARLYPTPPRRCHLPGYPFAADRHWVSARETQGEAATAPFAAGAEAGGPEPDWLAVLTELGHGDRSVDEVEQMWAMSEVAP